MWTAMVALISNLIHSLRYVVSSMGPSIPILSALSNCPSLSHPSGLPLPQVLHQQLDQTFIDRFDEVLVIGDVHGCYDELTQLIAQVKDNERILKLFVGDLVNKGPKSKEVINYMMKNANTCLSVRGNHDEVVIKQYLLYESHGKTALSEKNHWMTNLSRSHIDYLISLPYTFTIPSLNALIVHAGIVPEVELDKQNLKDMIEMRNLIVDQISGKVMSATSNHKEGVEWISRWTGPSHIYFGHDAKRKLQRTQFATGLDTGCVYGNSLTALFIHGPRSGAFVSQKASAVHSAPKLKNPE